MNRKARERMLEERFLNRTISAKGMILEAVGFLAMTALIVSIAFF